MTDPAPGGGIAVSLSSSDAERASVSPSVTVPEGATSANFSVTTIGVFSDVAVTLTATFDSNSATAALTVTASTLSSITIAPTAVTGTSMATGTVALSSSAPPGGASVALSSDSGAATLPDSVLVASGDSSANFTIRTSNVASTTVTISAVLFDQTRTVTLTINSCVTTTAAAPTIPFGETVWIDDSVPVGIEQGGTWDWDTAQKASGSQSHTAPAQAGFYTRYVFDPNSTFHIAATDTLVTYLLIDPCDPPQEIMLAWNAAGSGWEHRAFWGADLIDQGAPGTPARVPMGGLPTAGQWIRLSIPASTLDLQDRTLNGMMFNLYGGHAWFDRSGTASTCTPPIAAQPTIPAGETVWFDDSIPVGVEQYGTWNWDTTQKASGTQSHTAPAQAGPASRNFFDPSSTFYIAATDTLVTYVLVDPCDPPQEIMLEWHAGGSGWEHRAFWGADLIDQGAPGTSARVPMGGLQTAGQWIRLSIPASTLDLGDRTLDGMSFRLYGGHAWFDRSGKASTCTPPIAALPTIPPVIRSGSKTTYPRASSMGAPGTGTRRRKRAVPNLTPRRRRRGSQTVTSLTPAARFYIAATDTLVTYVLVDPCDPPQEIMLEWNSPGSSWEHRAFWGQDLIDRGTSGTPSRVSLGALPTAGQWIRLSIPANTLDLGGRNLYGVSFCLYGGHAWFDRSGKGNPNGASVLSAFSVSPSTVVGGGTSTATVSLIGVAPAGGLYVNLSTSNSTVTSLPSGITVNAGASEATFTVSTTAVATQIDVILTAAAGGETKTATLTLLPPGAPAPGTVTGTVVNASGGAAISGATVSVNGTASSTATDASGAFSVDVAAGSYTLTVTKPGFNALTTGSITVTNGQTTTAGTLSLTLASALAGLSLSPSSLAGGSTSTGTVTLTAGAPAGGTVISLSSDNASAAVPASVTVVEGATTATFMVTTTAVVSVQTATITATAGVVVRTASLLISQPLPTGELTEGNASDWTSFASDSAATSLTDDTSHVRSGTHSLKLVTASGGDTGIRYPAVGQVHWDLTSRAFLTFWAYIESSGTFAGNQPTLVLLGPSGSIRYTPSSSLTFANQWHHYEIALTGDSGWTRTVTGAMDLTNVVGLEVHHQASPAGFTAYYDDLSLVSTLPGDLAEGNAADWGMISGLAISNDTTHVRSGSLSIDFSTASGFDTGVVFPAAGDAHWDLSAFDSLTFWIYAINSNPGSFQNPQPVFVLRSPNGSYTYTPSGTLMSIDTWRLYQIPLSGGGPWSRSSTGSPTLSDVNQIELHFDTWGYGFELYIDGLTFGDTPNMAIAPNLSALSLNPPSVSGGETSTATVALTSTARAGGVSVALSSDNASAVVPTSLVIPANALSGQFTVATSSVGAPVTASISGLYIGITKSAPLAINPSAISTLSGVVLSLPSGAVLPGATVTVNETGATATTNVAGAFAFALPAGSYTVTASLGGYQPATSPLLTVTAGQRTTAAPLYLARPTGTFTGLVVTGSNPVAGAVVTATPSRPSRGSRREESPRRRLQTARSSLLLHRTSTTTS